MTFSMKILSGGSKPIHVIEQETSHSQPKARVVVNTLVILAEQRRDIFNAKSPAR
jgi:hypothetical protein